MGLKAPEKPLNDPFFFFFFSLTKFVHKLNFLSSFEASDFRFVRLGPWFEHPQTVVLNAKDLCC